MHIQDSFPRLRSVEFQPVLHRGGRYLFLRDPLGLSKNAVIVPEKVAPVLRLCDGTTPLGAFREILRNEAGLVLQPNELVEMIRSLDDALLLSNQRSLEAQAHHQETYRMEPFRQPTLAGRSYPSDPEELCGAQDLMLRTALSTPDLPGEIRGLISPHIDFERGGSVYASVWEAAREALREAELAVIFGTDHFGPDLALTLTLQNYATPYGVIPTHRGIVAELAAAIGEDSAFAGELYHRGEHSIELASVWLHYMRAGEPCDLVPILCGSFGPFVRGEAHIESDGSLKRAVQTLRNLISKRKSVVIAAADLAHVGPVFGGEELSLQDHAQLQREDHALIRHVCAGDAHAFAHAIIEAEDQFNVCGTAPIFLSLETLRPCTGTLLDYEHCPADPAHRSSVTICGIALHNM